FVATRIVDARDAGLVDERAHGERAVRDRRTEDRKDAVIDEPEKGRRNIVVRRLVSEDDGRREPAGSLDLADPEPRRPLEGRAAVRSREVVQDADADVHRHARSDRRTTLSTHEACYGRASMARLGPGDLVL